MKEIFPYISPLIESQFPSFYKEEGQNFIAFVKAYYEWLETENNVLWHTRRLLNTFDVDDTSEDFIVYFKEQILKNVQFTTASNKRLFIKNALDFYRSKGTARNIDLFFKLVYGKSAKVNYPADSLFRLSDNNWKIPIYLEISNSPYNKSYNGKQIRGLTSGSTAFVEGYSTRKINSNILNADGFSTQVSKLLNILYITNLSDDFITGETIVHNDIDDPDGAPTIIGSATSLEILAGGANYKVGDIVELKSATGILGKGIVREVENSSGQVTFELIKGGWGYTTSPNIIVAPKTIKIRDVTTKYRSGRNPYEYFEHLLQPLGNVHFISANSDISQFIETGDTLKISDGTNVKSNIQVITTLSSQPYSNGDLYFSVVSGNTASELYSDISDGSYANTYQVLTDSDLIVANISSFIDKSAFANIIGFKDTSLLKINDITGSVLPVVGETIIQKNSIDSWGSATVTKVVASGSTAEITLDNFVGSFVKDIDFSDNSFEFLASANLETSNSSIDFTQFQPGDKIIITNTTSNNNDGTYTIRNIHSSSLLEIVEGWPNPSIIPDTSYVNITTNFRIIGETSGSNSHLQSYDYYLGLNETSVTSIVGVDLNSPPVGANYADGELLIFTTVDGGGGAAANVTVDGSGGITSVDMIRGGIGYLEAPIVGIDGSGTGANGNMTAVLGNEFDFAYTDTYVVSEDTNTSGYIDTISTGSLASFRVVSLDDEEEDLIVFTDLINDVNVYGQIYADIENGVGFGINIDSTAYGFPKFPTADLNSVINDALNSETLTVGSIAAISASNPGEDYNVAPVVTVIEPNIYKFKKNDYTITTVSPTSAFLNGEKISFKIRKVINANTEINDLDDRIIVGSHPFSENDPVIYTTDLGATAITGLNPGATYYVKDANVEAIGLSSSPGSTKIAISPTLFPTQKHYFTQQNGQLLAEIEDITGTNTLDVIRKTFVASVYPSSNTIITGESSGYSSSVAQFNDRYPITGLNSIIDSSVVTANGVVTSMDIYDSGFGYQYFNSVDFNRIGTNEDIGTAKVLLGKQGYGEGFYKNRKSFLSETSYLHDGDYYQEFSYEIESAIPFEKYFEMLKKVLHLAGTKMFPANIIDSKSETNINSVKQFERELIFNPFTNLTIATNQFNIDSHGFNTDDKVVYTYDQGNTAIGITGTFNISEIDGHLGSGIVTVTTGINHGFSNGDNIVIDGTTNFDGNYLIFNASGNTFDYLNINSSAIETSGTVRHSLYFNQELLINKIDTDNFSVDYANGTPIDFDATGNYQNETGHYFTIIS